MTLRDLPSVHALLDQNPLLVQTFGHSATLNATQAVLADLRGQIRDGTLAIVPPQAQISTQIGDWLARRFQTSLRPLINATGVILHTNLGRAPLSHAAIEAVQRVAANYSNLELDLLSGERGTRHSHIEQVLAQTLQAEAGMVVNNAAGALLLSLSALAHGREVIISRGQLVEIGGGFRIPEVMAQSGAKLVEVGTTNRTRPSDYAGAISAESVALLRVHSSNFKLVGFTESVSLGDLATLAHKNGLLCIDDLGSGALLDTAAYGLQHEPTVQESLAAGADVVIFSGDKLLGGPQAGIIVGKAAALDRLKQHPLARALRVDKLTLAALLATLDHYQRGQATQHIPSWRMIAKPLDEIHHIATRWAARVPGEVLAGESTIGGGSLPGETLPSWVFAPQVRSAQATQTQLRASTPPLIARVRDDRLLLDPRTVLDEQIEQVSSLLLDI